MAVYTKISEDEMRGLLSRYDLGTLQSYEGISKGVSNTNYHVFADKGRYVLTIFEPHRVNEKDLPYFFAYSDHLVAKGIPCPEVYRDKKGERFQHVSGKPAAIISYLEGRDITRGETMEKHCSKMGAFLGQMHNAVKDFQLKRENDWGIKTWRGVADSVAGDMDQFHSGLRDVVYEELDYLEGHWPKGLPSGAVHLDLFADNIFFKRDKISAMIDMYFAAEDYLAFDLAITTTAWCFSTKRNWRRPAFRRFIQEYEWVRPMSEKEKEAFQVLSRGACMRFLLSRLQEWFAYDPAMADMKPHDPREYLEKLRFHQENDVMACLI